jgi:hypothetical protein
MLLIVLIITASGPEKFQITMQAFSITLSPGPVYKVKSMSCWWLDGEMSMSEKEGDYSPSSW